MPNRPMSICTYPNCPRLVQSGRCKEHQRQSRQRHDASRRDDVHRALYRTERWKRYSAKRLAQHPWCVGYPSGIHGNQQQLAEVTDHIQPAHAYPELFFEPTNHQSLCRACNTAKGQNEPGMASGGTDRGGRGAGRGEGAIWEAEPFPTASRPSRIRP